ncbi:hypothetical protein [Nonomuraea insulae]|uniref:Uncharacterized protein n=1 Tax=Nonomuraea insulae TaxID=1616787 RepID=A0ABW1DDR4_9ACTN
MATMAGCLAFTGTSAAVAETPAQQKASALTCGGNVFLDGLRALEITENGRDEVYIGDLNGNKIWPTTAAYVSIGVGQRVEVDKCVSPSAQLILWEEDTADFDDFIGSITIAGDVTRDYTFCCAGNGGNYRIGAVA